MEIYQCSDCKEIYEKGWSDEEANQEAIELHGKSKDDEDMVIVCDDCFNKMRSQGLF